MGRRRRNALAKQAPLTPMERRLIDGMAQGLSVSEAAREAGYKHVDSAHRKMRPDGKEGARFRAAFLELCEKQGLTDKALLKPIKEALKATDVKWNTGKRRWDRFVSHPTRTHAAELGLKLKGRFPKDDERGSLVAVNITTNLSGGDDGPSPVSGGFNVSTKVDSDQEDPEQVSKPLPFGTEK